MIEREGDTAFASRARSQSGGGAYVNSDSTMTVTNGSSIGGNYAGEVCSPAFAVASGLVVGSPSHQPTLDLCERETSR